jgi:tetratricopeptide (TPR) repeat protein
LLRNPGNRKKKDDLIRAERMLRKCVKIIQNNNCVHARAFSKLALFIDSMLHDKEESLEYFKLAAKAAPDDADHAFNLASHLEDTKDMEGAVKWSVPATRTASHPALFTWYPWFGTGTSLTPYPQP